MPFPEILVWKGEIADLEADAIVVPASESLWMTGAAATVKRRAGEPVERAAVAQGPTAAGTAVVTDGGELAARWIIHAVAVGHDLRADPRLLHGAATAALRQAEALGVARLAVPLLGTDRGVFEAADAAAVLLEAVDGHVAAGSTALSELVIVVGSDAELLLVERQLAARAEAR